jgi:hypothetical protein
MSDTSFHRFMERLLGDWVGQRRSAAFDREPVRARWAPILDRGFLHERWSTAGGGHAVELAAEAFFRATDDAPGDFVAVYRDGRIAFGESSFDGVEWTLTHRWLREPGVAVIRLRFVDDDTYEQEVAEVAADGSLSSESHAVMRRERGPG